MAQARWLVHVDWNDDGDFSDSNEDISADVIDMTLEHFRDLLSGHVEAARLELKVRNNDHKYSAPNGSSPLSGNLKPGRKVWVRAAYPYDSFSSSAGGTQLAAHVPDYDSSFSWAENLRNFDIVSAGGSAETDSVQSNGDCVATMDFSDADVSFGCDFTRGTDTSDHGGLCFRYSDTSNYLYVRVTGTLIEVRKVEAGSDSQITSKTHTWSVSTQKFLQVTLHGNSIRVFVDNSEVVDTTSSFNNTATKHGLFCDDQADHTWDNFGGWVSLFYGAIDSIHPRPRLGAQYCYIRALDEMERLTSTTLYTYAGSQLPQTSDIILGDILNYAAVESSRRQLDTGVTLVPELWSPPIWGVQGIDEIYRLQDEEDGFVYVDGHGYWRLEARAHRTTAPHTSSKATIKDTDDGSNPYFSELVWDDGVNNIENMVFMRMRDATNNGLQVVWTLKEKPSFAANETKDFLGESVDYDVVPGQVGPAENTDYEANTLEDGSGTDISSELTVTHPNTEDFNGKGTLIKVEFGNTAGYLTLLKLRTLNALTYDDPLLLLAEDTTSKSTYGRRIKSIEARWTREVDVAQATVDNRLARRKDPKTTLNIVVLNGSKSNMMAILQRGFSDRVTVSYSDMGINEDFYIEGHKMTVSEGWTMVTGEFLLQGV
ncbi:MAG: hypothetical protein IIC84_06975 [Chloroflexi bacterium]|nr:hypothetical protein [Chloroflexota bacterium]